MTKISTFFKKLTKTKYILTFLVLSILVSLLLGNSMGVLEHGIPDTHLHYSADDFYALMEKYSDKELGIYVRGMLLYDFIYPVFYSLFLALLIYRLSRKTQLSILPFGILIFDYLENLSVLSLIKLLPSQNYLLASFAGFFTLIKWMLAALCIIIILVLGSRSLNKFRLERK